MCCVQKDKHFGLWNKQVMLCHDLTLVCFFYVSEVVNSCFYQLVCHILIISQYIYLNFKAWRVNKKKNFNKIDIKLLKFSLKYN